MTPTGNVVAAVIAFVFAIQFFTWDRRGNASWLWIVFVWMCHRLSIMLDGIVLQ